MTVRDPVRTHPTRDADLFSRLNSDALTCVVDMQPPLLKHAIMTLKLSSGRSQDTFLNFGRVLTYLANPDDQMCTDRT